MVVTLPLCLLHLAVEEGCGGGMFGVKLETVMVDGSESGSD